MTPTEIALIGSIILLTMFGYVKYKDIKRDMDKIEEEIWLRATTDRVSEIERDIEKLENNNK